MGYKHTEDDILDGALAVAFADGLSQLTYGRVAKRLDISDRVVVYYFPTKDDLVAAVLGRLGAQLQQTLAPAFDQRSADHLDLARKAWPVLARPDADPIFGLFFEASGLAANGRDPYRTVVPQLVEAWIAWAAGFVEASDEDDRHGEAAAAIALIDGLLLLRQLSGAEAADSAARHLGVL